MALEEYRKKRRFSGTPEPAPTAARPRRELSFVVQKHAARRLHYDFRLEVDGALKSWAVPKGPSYDPAEKRLAVAVEDHPMDYGRFEGVIPERHYGAGPVIVWDTGTYTPDDEDGDGGRPADDNARMREQLKAGKVSITLRGHKLRGSWALVRTRGRGGAQDQWLLIKHRDEYTGMTALSEDEHSVLSSRTIEDVRRGMPARDGPGPTAGRPAPFPSAIRPMLATLAPSPFDRPGWFFEPKLDGVRAIAALKDGRVILRSRLDNVITDHYPEIAAALTSIARQDMVLDGEIVALDEHGVPDFELLQQRMHLAGDRARGSAGRVPVVYYVFDLLYAAGRDLMGIPLEQRKALLRQAVPEGELVRLVHHEDGHGVDFYRAATGMGLEGVIAKRGDSPYEPGVRSPSWLKIKAVQEQEFLVCGYLPGKGHRASSFGALVLGFYDGDRLRYAGTAGSGFRDEDLGSLMRRLKALATETSPFPEPIPRQAEKPRWVKPVLVAQVKFAEWTKAGILRAPVFLGLREDVEPGTVIRERPIEAASLRQAQGTSAPRPLRLGSRHASTGAGNVSAVAGDAPLPNPAPSLAPDPRELVASVVEQLDNERDGLTLAVGEARIKLTNLNKVLWPSGKDHPERTKRDLIRYLALVSEHMLPHLRERPMNLTRYPGGIDKPHFFQKHWAFPIPDYVARVSLYSEHTKGDQEYIKVENLPTLLWLGQLANIEFHPWLSRVTAGPDAAGLPTVFTGSEEAIDRSVLSYPDFIIFDLDPYIYSGKEAPRQEPELNRRAFDLVKEVAVRLREVLDGLALEACVKTTGKTGLHLYVPVMRHYDYDVIRQSCATIGRFLSDAMPGKISMDWTVTRRTGRVFFDHNQNVRGKTLAAAYSPRPTSWATVSVPIRWDELEEVYPTDFTMSTVPARLATIGDPWKDILEHKHDLRPLLEGPAHGPGGAGGAPMVLKQGRRAGKPPGSSARPQRN